MEKNEISEERNLFFRLLTQCSEELREKEAVQKKRTILICLVAFKKNKLKLGEVGGGDRKVVL